MTPQRYTLGEQIADKIDIDEPPELTSARRRNAKRSKETSQSCAVSNPAASISPDAPGAAP
jgi:hypothetical protein